MPQNIDKEASFSRAPSDTTHNPGEGVVSLNGVVFDPPLHARSTSKTINGNTRAPASLGNALPHVDSPDNGTRSAPFPQGLTSISLASVHKVVPDDDMQSLTAVTTHFLLLFLYSHTHAFLKSYIMNLKLACLSFLPFLIRHLRCPDRRTCHTYDRRTCHTYR
jgi:hypothetical protein